MVIPKEGALYILKEEFYETKPAWWPFVSTPWPVFMEPCLAGEQAALLAGVRASSGLPSFAHPLHRRPPGPVSRCGDRRTAGGAGSGSTSALSITYAEAVPLSVCASLRVVNRSNSSTYWCSGVYANETARPSDVARRPYVHYTDCGRLAERNRVGVHSLRYVLTDDCCIHPPDSYRDSPCRLVGKDPEIELLTR